MTKPRTHLTARQARILAAINEHLVVAGYPPSVREIGAAVGLASTASVHHHLRVLEAKGYLRRTANQSRAVVIRSDAGDVAA